MEGLKKTPLYPVYQELGAKTIDFGGWDLPVQFSSIKEEHYATRQAAGLFDVSHMGEISVEGNGSTAFLQRLLTNDLSKLAVNRAQYNLMCYENGGTVDDLLVYKQGEEKYLLVVNAANTEKDFEWIKKHAPNEVSVENKSEKYFQLAIQGPRAEQILQRLTPEPLSEISFFRFKDRIKLSGLENEVLISRTGYTGEDGFEVYGNPSDAVTLWKKLLEVGSEDGLLPVGLGARDTLRFEATLPLYGQEISSDITPIEAGLGFAVKTNKEEDFIGKSVLKEQKENGPNRRLVGLEMIEKGIPRHGYLVFDGEEEIGFVTTGTQSPTLEKNIGLALVPVSYAEEGRVVEVQVRKRKLKAKVISTPFYKRK